MTSPFSQPGPQSQPAKTKTGASPVHSSDAKDSGQLKAVRNLSALMEEIAAARAETARRDGMLDDLQRRLMQDLGPVEDQILSVRIDTLRILGRSLKSGWLKKRSRELILDALRSLADDLENGFGADLKKERKEFLDEEEDHWTEVDEDIDGLDAEAGEDGSDGEGEFSGAHSGDGEPKSKGRNWDSADEKAHAHRRGDQRPGSKAAGKREEQEQALVGDIRALYIMLARALHPDKEPDAARRQEKTAWMQKVAAAYENRNLAQLLDILAQNPLNAVGPYLSQAPIKTIQGFAKRLRRELTALQQQMAKVQKQLPRLYAMLLKAWRVDEGAYTRHLSEMRSMLKVMKERRKVYMRREGVEELARALRDTDWDYLL